MSTPGLCPRNYSPASHFVWRPWSRRRDMISMSHHTGEIPKNLVEGPQNSAGPQTTPCPCTWAAQISLCCLLPLLGILSSLLWMSSLIYAWSTQAVTSPWMSSYLPLTGSSARDIKMKGWKELHIDILLFIYSTSSCTSHQFYKRIYTKKKPLYSIQSALPNISLHLTLILWSSYYSPQLTGEETGSERVRPAQSHTASFMQEKGLAPRSPGFHLSRSPLSNAVFIIFFS